MQIFKEACQRMDRALREFRIRGVRTNIPFLENVVNHPTFQSGDATTRFLDETPELFQFTPRKDRATRLLKYLGETIVNGNSEVGRQTKAGEPASCARSGTRRFLATGRHPPTAQQSSAPKLSPNGREHKSNCC